MKVIGFSAPGGPEVLQLCNASDPAPSAGEVVLDIAATAVNRADLLQRQGLYAAPKDAVPWLGLEASGIISAVGADVGGWRIGERACALLSGGGYAEKVAVPVGQLFPVPDNLSLWDAAALPEAVCTVWSNLFMLAQLQRGELLLVHGGASGIGTMAIQLARSFGARVAVTAGSADKLSKCQELGADILVNYHQQDFVTSVLEASGGHGADVILDIVGARYLQQNIDVLAVKGRIVVIGLQGGTRAELDLGKLLRKRGTLHATALRAQSLQEKAAIVSRVREHVWPLIATGAVRPVIHASLPLAAAAQAHQILQDSSHVGKVLLIVTPQAK